MPTGPKPNPANLSPLGRRLVALTTARGHASLRAAAIAANISYTQLHDIVAGKVDPRVSTLERLVEALGGTMAELYRD